MDFNIISAVTRYTPNQPKSTMQLPLTILLSLSLPSLSLSAPTIQTTSFFTLTAARSASPIHFGSVTANETGIWIGKTSSNYCPGVENQTCPDPSPYTEFTLNNGVLGLGVQVKGGQQIYVDYNGRVRYTLANDGYVPTGAYISGWTWEEGESFGRLDWVNGTLFCGLIPGNSSVGPWQLFAKVPFVDFGAECLGASLLASGNLSTANAYEYV
ncbi:hypothetical protein AC579_8257 [Pseudocercospora musae]|uniref:B30.2/SPRY domain-containing protein n=1 Tax=Pseudocercospora musae TaxID=113226 RepID=A0A139IVL3_9PEZI|nr:hypothetical protein AC579_8257 [Pseudocercospora musae]